MSAENIYNKLYQEIGNPYGVAGLMGNLKAESGLKSARFESLCKKRLREAGKGNYTDETYTAAIDEGRISEAEFLNPLPGKQYGYGLAQWTSPARKKRLYELAKSRGVSIGDEDMQIDFLIEELRKDYPRVLRILKDASTVREASDAVLKEFEKPANTSEKICQLREKYGLSYLKGDISMNELQKKFHDSYKQILGRNKYNQDLRSFVFTPYKGIYYSDCSSSICACMDRIGIKMPLLNTAGMYHSKLWKKVPVTIRDGHIHEDDIKLLRVGDALLFRGNDPSRPLQIGHVEAIYRIDGDRENLITLCGHGSGTPSLKNMRDYLSMRERGRARNGKTKGLVCVIRCIPDAPDKKHTPGWHKDDRGWWYADSENTYVRGKWMQIEGRWYVFDDAGYMITGWFREGEKWYYLNSDGAMLSGQWLKYRDRFYYLTEDGSMARNQYIKSETKNAQYWVDDEGAWDPKK